MPTDESGGRTIRDTIRNHNYGDLIITSKRIVFMSKDDSFEYSIYSINEISGIKLLDNQSFLIQSGNSSKNILVDSIILSYVFGTISYIRKATSDEINLLYTHNNNFTPEQLNYFEMIRQECSKIRVKRKTNNNGCVGCLTLIIIILLIFITPITILGLIIGSLIYQ